jgi:hypothetical protein
MAAQGDYVAAENTTAIRVARIHKHIKTWRYE